MAGCFLTVKQSDSCSKIQAILEKQSYMLIGRHDIEKLIQRDPARSCLPNPFGQPNMYLTVEFGANKSGIMFG